MEEFQNRLREINHLLKTGVITVEHACKLYGNKEPLPINFEMETVETRLP